MGSIINVCVLFLKKTKPANREHVCAVPSNIPVTYKHLRSVLQEEVEKNRSPARTMRYS